MAVVDIATIVQASLRSGIAAILVVGLIFIKGGWHPSWQGTLKSGIMVYRVFTSEFLFIALGLQYTTASHIALFLCIAPIFIISLLFQGVIVSFATYLVWFWLLR